MLPKMQSQDLLLDYASNPETTDCNLLFYPQEQLCEYAGDSKQVAERRAQCVAELFVREFLKKGKAKAEINAVLTDDELAHFWSRIGEDFLDIHETRMFPLDVLWDSTNEFSRICEIAVREKLRELCEVVDGFIPVYLGKQSLFIPFHFEKSEKVAIVDLAGNPIPLWQAPHARLFPEGKYRCIVHCDQSGLLQGNRQKNVFTGNSLMLPLYLAFLRREEKLEYNPLRLIATGEIDENRRLKSVETAEKAIGFHLSFDNSSYFVYPESTKYSSTERNEVALPRFELDQVEEYFRVRGLFVRAKQGREESLCSIRPAMSKSFVGRWEELMTLNKQICGHIPVITGDAGVGKTELAVAYADLYAENFPQGRFMIPMQGIHSWTDAMSKMVEWCNVCGIMTEQLGLPEDYNKLPPEEKRKKAYRMLLSRAKKGRVLLLLDNLEDLSLISETGLWELTGPAEKPSELHVYATTRIREKHGLAVQTPMEIGNLKERDALDFFYKVCGNTLQKQVEDIEQEYAALREIIGLLKGHAWSLEIVAGRFASHVREFGKDEIRKERDAIQKNLTDTLKGKTHRSVENNAEILLKPTIDLILKKNELVDGLGQKILCLADYASFFPPEQIPEYALSGLWKDTFCNFSLTLDEISFEQNGMILSGKTYDYAMTQLKNFRIINGDEPMFKMHRLTREVLQNRMSEEEKNEALGNMFVFIYLPIAMGIQEDDTDPCSPFRSLTVEMLQPWCKVMDNMENKWAKEPEIFQADLTYLALTRKTLNMNMYRETEHLLSLDFELGKENKANLADYNQIKGEYYLNQSLFQKAEDAIKASILCYHELMADPPETLNDISGLSLYCAQQVRNLRLLASIHQAFSCYSEAEKDLFEALNLARKYSKECEEAMGEVLTDLANLHCNLFQYDKAEEELENALEISQKNKWSFATQSSETNKYTPETLKTLAKLHLARGHYEDAEQKINEALEEYCALLESSPEEIYPHVADTLNLLAEVHHMLGSDADAEAELLDCLSIYREFAQNNPTVYTSYLARTLNSLASLYQETGQNAEAEEKRLECLTICYEQVMNNPDVFSKIILEALNNFASAQVELTQYDAIESVLSGLRDVFSQLVEVEPERFDCDFANMLDSFANIHEKLNRIDVAKTERQKASTIRANNIKR